MRSALLAASLSALAGTGLVSQAGAPVPREMTVLEDGRLAPGWKDLGWAAHELSPGKPARVDFSAAGGLVFFHEQQKPDFAGVVLRLRAPASFGDFLEISL